MASQQNLVSQDFSFQSGLGENGFWRSLITIFICVFGVFLGGLPLLVVLGSSEQVQQRGFDPEKFSTIALNLSEPVYLVLVLLPFVLGLLALLISVKLIHQRSIKSLFTAHSSGIRWSRIVKGAGFWLLLLLVAAIFEDFRNPQAYIFDFEPSKFYPTLAVLLVLLPLQVTFEEVAIRGYLHQLVVHVFKFPWLGVVVSSMIFGALHFTNPEVTKYGLFVMATYYIGVGAFLAILTILDNGLELALGIHFATNLFSTVFVNTRDSALPVSSVFIRDTIDVKIELLLFLLQAFVFFSAFAKTSSWDWRTFTSLSPPK